MAQRRRPARHTTYPYTEGLALTLTGVTLWRTTRLWQKPSWRSGLELGLWLGLVFPARKQMFTMTLAAGVVFAVAVLAARGYRARYAVMAACAAATFLAVLAPHYVQLRGIVYQFDLTHMLRWDQTRFSDALPQIPMLVEVEGLGAYLRDRAEGFAVAFSLAGKGGYGQHFHYLHYGVVLAVPLLVVRAVQHGRPLRLLVPWLTRPKRLAGAYAVVFALGAFASLHTMHMHTYASDAWLFLGRWALPCVFAFFFALVLLLAERRGPWFVLAALLVIGSLDKSADEIRALTAKAESARKPGMNPLARWLNDKKSRRKRLIVAYRRPQVIAHETPDVNYHWYHNGTSLEDVEAMVTKLDVEFLLVPSERFRRLGEDTEAFRHSFELVKTVGGVRVYSPTKALLERRLPRKKPKAPLFTPSAAGAQPSR